MGQLLSEPVMLEQAIQISDSEIVVSGQFFIHKNYSTSNRDVFLDILGSYYNGQTIRIKFPDGENFNFSGFDNFMVYVCQTFSIPTNKIIIETHNPAEPSRNRFNVELLGLGIFSSANKNLPKLETFNKDLTDAKFVGCLLGRYNVTRLRLAYELDTTFINDTYITYQPKYHYVTEELRHFKMIYFRELNWLINKKFDKDLSSVSPSGTIDWMDGCNNYNNVWNKYQIEVVSETDSISDFWFTEKTANCLATGKPFVLVSGQGSLKRLRNMGFKTFDTVLDESYDLAKHPYERIKRLTYSLGLLYNSPNRDQQIGELYNIASQNIELYKKYIQTVKKS
jgi:hypothetical protein